MRIHAMQLKLIMTGAVLALCATTAWGTTIQDLVRIKGHERNVLTGMGIVVGLNGTGDTVRDSSTASSPAAGNDIGVELASSAASSAISACAISKP